MANTKSAKKRARQTIKRNARNTKVRNSVKTAIRTAREAIETGSKDVQNAVKGALSSLAKAANKKVMHKNTAARKISRLMKKMGNPVKPAKAAPAKATKKAAAKKTSATA